MKLEIQIDGRTRELEFARAGDRFRWKVDGRAVNADAVEIARGIYSILIDGQSYEVRIETRGAGLHVRARNAEFAVEVHDPRRWRKRRAGAHEAKGRNQIVAPMPGKVMHVLVNEGDAVEAGRGIVVVEAMKMQNEIRAPISGTVERLLVVEGQAVNSGDVLAIIA